MCVYSNLNIVFSIRTVAPVSPPSEEDGEERNPPKTFDQSPVEITESDVAQSQLECGEVKVCVVLNDL